MKKIWKIYKELNIQQLHPFSQHNTLTTWQFLERQCVLICITIMTSLETGLRTRQLMETNCWKSQFYKFYQKFISNLKNWPKTLPKDSKNQVSIIQLSQKYLKIFCFSYWDNFMQITLSSLLPHPINITRRFHLTLLTSCILPPCPINTTRRLHLTLLTNFILVQYLINTIRRLHLTLLPNCILVAYPINTIRMLHLTLLTNCILVPYPINTIRRLHLTPLINCILVPCPINTIRIFH